MKSACVGVLSIIELKNARWNTEKRDRDDYPLLHRTPDKLCGDMGLRCMTDGRVARAQPRGVLRTNNVDLRQQKLLRTRGNLTGINSWSTRQWNRCHNTPL